MFNFITKKQNFPEKVQININRIEEHYNILFPEILRDLYSQCEGGKVKLCVFTIDGITYEVSTIIPIMHEGLHFEKIVDNDRMDGFIPSSFYPIAMDRGGNIYYWDCSTKKVYLSLIDDIENPVLINDSVESFIQLLNNSVRS